MIYTELTKKAMRLAYRAHHGQLDKAGVPYIFHPYHLAEQMNDEISVCAALLHDVVEDTAVTPEELAAEFPPEVVNAVMLLTHTDVEDYFDYVRKVSRDPVAAKVKLADLRHNSDASRLPSPIDSRAQARLKKYAAAIAILEQELKKGHGTA